MSFVYYRLPQAATAFRNRLHDEPEELASLAELSGRHGFVIAPFCADESSPILLVPAEWEAFDIGNIDTACCHASLNDSARTTEREHYAVDFTNYHAQLRDGLFAKIVLARHATLTASKTVDPVSLFARACRLYPRMFVALFSTERSGTWLVATPEILLKGHGCDFQTMALAGTMRPGGQWSTKNRKEQHYVESYITECVEHFTDNFSVDGPYTSQAGDLVHLRSDIRFRLDNNARLGDMLNTLHPTPAVCGMPKEATREFIQRNESAPRGYYSGFSGLLDDGGETALYVTLRCMSMAPPQYTLYAGGGLLADSDELSEWEETEAKMNTMKQLFSNV